MANLSIKNVPDAVVKALRERARRNHRSLQGELLALVTRMTAEPGGSANDLAAEGTVGVDIEVIAREHRGRLPQPVAEAPQSTEIVRAERDAR
jgi:plasmid stability protein